MHNISVIQALDVWTELWQAYCGENHFGGDIAEIYAYTVMPHTPTLEHAGFEKEKRQAGLQAAQSLYALLIKFKKENQCRITVSDQPLGKWFITEPFFHRCYVRIIKKQKK